MLRRWCIPLAALAIAFGPALAAGSASATVTPATPTPSAAALIAADAAHDAHASQPAATSATSGFTHACAAVIVVGKQACLALKRDGIHPMAADTHVSGVSHPPNLPVVERVARPAAPSEG